MRGHVACALGRRSSQASAVAAASVAAIHINGAAGEAAATGSAPVAAITATHLRVPSSQFGPLLVRKNT